MMKCERCFKIGSGDHKCLESLRERLEKIFKKFRHDLPEVVPLFQEF